MQLRNDSTSKIQSRRGWLAWARVIGLPAGEEAGLIMSETNDMAGRRPRRQTYDECPRQPAESTPNFMSRSASCRLMLRMRRTAFE